MEKEKSAKNKGRAVRAYVFWLRTLYRESPAFVWLYLAEIPVTVGIFLAGAYLPSVLTADITAGEPVGRIVLNLAVLGGLLVFLQALRVWLHRTQEIRDDEIRLRHVSQMVKEVLNTEYKNVEKGDFQNRFMELTRLHLWNGNFSSKFMQALQTAGTAAAGLLLYTGMLSGLSLWLLAVILVCTAANYFVAIRCNRWESENRHKWWPLDLKMQYLSRNLGSYEAAKDVHLYHMAPWLKKLYDRTLKERLHFTFRMQANYYVMALAWGFTGLIWQGAAYGYLIWAVCAERILPSEFVLYIGLLLGFAQWCSAITRSVQSLHEQALYVEEHQSFMDKLKPEEEGDKEPLLLKKGHIPEICFRNVTFQYPGTDKPVIKNLNLTLKPGENLALVGLNGAGKTTFIKLLCGFYDPTQGEILIDGISRSRYTRESWMRCISGVFQDMGFFPVSLRDNLAPEGGADAGRMEECLKMADLAEKTASLPAGLETLFGVGIQEGAAEFSGGEGQRLMLARAFYKEAPLLVLDEPTAALDPLAESRLYERYRQFSENKTTVFISHRLASTRFCDRILLMENGEIAETGTHEELMRQQGSYARMYLLQSKYYQQEEAGLEGEMSL